MSWLIKRRHYGGGESVVGRAESQATAEARADELNAPYQSNAYYAEEYDRAKVDWPDINDPRVADLIAAIKARRVST
jgi:hypothetical protein